MSKKGQSTTTCVSQSSGDESDLYYSLTIVNNNESAWNFFLSLQPYYDVMEIKPLAWQVSHERIKTGEQITFRWTASYEFMCAATSVPPPGGVFHVTDTESADLTTHNYTTLSMKFGKPTLSQPTKGQQAGSLSIHAESNIPPNEFSVGIANSKKGAYAVDAMPSMTYMFTPNPRFCYISTTDDHVAEGEVINPAIISQTTGVKFPSNVYTMTATYQSNNTWVIEPS